MKIKAIKQKLNICEIYRSVKYIGQLDKLCDHHLWPFFKNFEKANKI